MPAAAPSTISLDGGRYTAVRSPDGTWSILDVPVYPEHVLPAVYDAAGRCVQPEIPITRAWLEAAVRRAKFRALYDAYAAPAHVNHHAEVLPPGSPVREVLPAGCFVARRVGTLSYCGRPHACVYGDFVGIPAERFAEIESGRLRYRSAEVLNLRDPEISSVAFLPTQVPYFRLPMLTIGTKRAEAASASFTTSANVFRSTYRSPVVGFYRAGAAASALCYFAEAAPMPDDGTQGKKKPDEKGEKPAPGGDAPANPVEQNATPAAAAAATPPAAPEPAAPAPAAPAAPGQPAAADPMQAVTATLQRVEQALMLLCEKAGIAPKDERPAAAAESGQPGQAVPGPKGMSAAANPPAAAPASPAPAAPPAPATSPAPSAPAAPAAPTTDPALARAYQERDAAQATLRAQEAAAKRTAAIDGAVSRLKPFFIPEPDLRADLARAYAANGEEGVRFYASTVEQRFPPLPPADLETRGDGSTAGVSTDSAAVMAYQAKGPDALRAARGFSGTYQKLKRNLGAITEAQFIAAQFDEARRGVAEQPDADRE